MLKKTLPSHAVGAWFEPIMPKEIRGNVIKLEVPNAFFCDWIDSHYKKQLIEAINNHHEEKIYYEFVVSSKGSQVSPATLSSNPAPRKKQTFMSKNNINSQYRFDNFIEGSNNEFAKNAAKAVSENPGSNNFNPLIIYGGVGLGKTHLMHSIANGAIENNANTNAVLVTSEKFTLDFVNSLRKNKTIEFAQQYRSADLLLVDDIQFFRGKEQTQEQFFHTFNVLYQKGKQIVMTTDTYPEEMQGLQSRLLSRFNSGLSVDVQPPNFELRVAILLEKAEQNKLTLDYKAIEFIARHIKNNIRDLEGTIIRILAKSSLLNREIDFDLVNSVVKERAGGKVFGDITMEDVVKKVSKMSNIPSKEIIGKSRKMEIVEARHASIYLCREIIGASLSSIGIYFGGRDHTTIMHSINQVSSKIKRDVKVNNSIVNLKEQIEELL
jgi:chromosomal replication initiator protein